jgi:hypothetical protein
LVIVCAAPLAVAAGWGEPVLPPGAYAIRAWLELPNVLRPAAATTATLCLPQAAGPPIPLLGANLPFAGCPVTDSRHDGAALTFDIACPGRDGARARATYALTAQGFRGRIAMVMGGKNMTMTEVQDGRRVGDCTPAQADGAAP